MKALLSSLLLLVLAAGCLAQTTMPTAPVVQAKTIDYKAECVKLWPGATVVSGRAEAPRSTKLYFWVVAGKNAQSHSHFKDTEALAWRDAYYRTR